MLKLPKIGQINNATSIVRSELNPDISLKQEVSRKAAVLQFRHDGIGVQTQRP